MKCSLNFAINSINNHIIHIKYQWDILFHILIMLLHFGKQLFLFREYVREILLGEKKI